MPSSIWKKTADGLPPAQTGWRPVIAISKDLKGFPVVEKYDYSQRLKEWRQLDRLYCFPLEESIYWAYEEEVALEVLGEC